MSPVEDLAKVKPEGEPFAGIAHHLDGRRTIGHEDIAWYVEEGSKPGTFAVVDADDFVPNREVCRMKVYNLREKDRKANIAIRAEGEVRQNPTDIGAFVRSIMGRMALKEVVLCPESDTNLVPEVLEQAGAKVNDDHGVAKFKITRDEHVIKFKQAA